MDPQAFLNNLRTANKICPSLRNKMLFLSWLYRIGNCLPFLPKEHVIHFNFPDLNNLDLLVRENAADSFIFSEVFLHRCYSFDLGFVPHRILDLGANIGLSTIFFAKQFSEAAIAAVEPMADNLRLLRRNLELNSVRATIVPAAIAISDGCIEMEIAEKEYGHKVSGIEFGRKLEGNKVTVNSISIPSLLQQLDWNEIDFLKVDIEGYEGILFADNPTWLARVKALCIEVHENIDSERLVATARDFGLLDVHNYSGLLLMHRSKPN